MEVSVDLELCEANAVCMGLVPSVFELDDDDVLHIQQPDPSAGLEDVVQLAVESCPKNALRMRE